MQVAKDIFTSTMAPLHISKLLGAFDPRYDGGILGAIGGPVLGTANQVGKDITSFVANPQEGTIWKSMVGLTPAGIFKAPKEAAKEIDLFE
jgi:hypothetical protein